MTCNAIPTKRNKNKRQVARRSGLAEDRLDLAGRCFLPQHFHTSLEENFMTTTMVAVEPLDAAPWNTIGS